MDVIGAKVICGGHTGRLLGYRQQAETNARGRIITPPDKRWVVSIDLGEECNSRDRCSESVEHGVVNHYSNEVTFADGSGSTIPSTPQSVADVVR
jgi:hypothetical protein